MTTIEWKDLINNYMWDVVILIFCLVLLWRGFAIVGEQIKEKGLGPNTLQALGLVVLLPSILMMSTKSGVPEELPATLIGAIAGYVFGVKANS